MINVQKMNLTMLNDDKLLKSCSKPGVLNLFRLTEHFEPKKICAEQDLQIPSEVVCFY
jgi:hypothetical protein